MGRSQPRLFGTIRTLAQVVDAAMDRLPSNKRGDIRAVCEEVKSVGTIAEWMVWCEQSLVQGVRHVLRSYKNGLPRAVSVNGRYVDPRQLEFPEFVTLAYAKAVAGLEYHQKVRELATICEQQTGRGFDPEDIIQSAITKEPIDDVLARLAS